MPRRTVATVYVRHRAKCKHHGQAFFRGCDCLKWLRYSGDACLCGRSHKGHQHRLSAETRTWMLAEEKAQELQKRLDAGVTAVRTNAQPTSVPRTISDELKTYITAKQGERLSPATLRKLKHQLNLFETFVSRRSKFFPSEITMTDVIELNLLRARGFHPACRTGLMPVEARCSIQSKLRVMRSASLCRVQQIAVDELS